MAVVIKNLPKCLSNPTHSIEPMWASDAGRNSNSGTFSGTFNGWYDTLEINIGETSQAELTNIRQQIETPTITATFLDTRTGNEKTEDFYGTVIKAERLREGYYKPFNFSLKAIKKRDDM